MSGPSWSRCTRSCRRCLEVAVSPAVLTHWKPLVVQSEDAGGGLVVTVGHPLDADWAAAEGAAGGPRRG